MNSEFLFSPFSRIYGAGIAARGAFYENGLFKSYDLGVPVVSIGNLTVGGTGKTPLVARVARILAETGRRVCILTRGYKRENPGERVLVSDGERVLASERQAGDEPFLLARELLNVAAVVADKNRVAAGRWARATLDANAFVLDDGFQHRRLKRDLDLVTIDATNPFGNRKLLPGGVLREPLTNLKRADAVVVTRANLSEHVQNLKAEISKYNANCPILLSSPETIGVTPLPEFLAAMTFGEIETNPKSEIRNLKSKVASAFCALGNPNGFFEHLRRDDFQISTTTSFQDHHRYAQTDVAAIEKAARESGAQILLTTAKDAVKLKTLNFSLPCFVVEIEVEFDDEEPLRKMLQTIVSGEKT